MDLRAGRSQTMGVQVLNVSPAEVYEVIVGASSQDYSRIQASSRRLKELMDMFGTFDALQEIATRRDLPLPVRKQAIIQFKNAVLQHWRSRKLLSDEHRARIRQRCLTFIDEDDETIAECNEVVVVKLARMDYPTAWPELINDLVQTIDANLQKRYVVLQDDPRDTLKLRRSLKLLNCVLKEFASIKLPTGMKAMAQIVSQLRLLLYGYYSRMSATFSEASITPGNVGSQIVYENILLSHLVYKCLVKMATWLWNKLEKLTQDEFKENYAWLEELFKNSLTQVKSLVILRKSLLLAFGKTNDDQASRTFSILTRHLRVFGKFFRRIQQLSTERFAKLPISVELVLFYWSEIVDSTNYPQSEVSDSDNTVFPVRFLVQALVLFKDSLSQWTPIKRSGMPNQNVLSREFVEDAVRLLVTRFVPLNTVDLENWMAEPEDWVNLEDKESDQWEYEIRACAERVITQLCNQFPDFVVPLLASTFRQIAPQHSADLEALVQKEALYCAIGRCARRLKAAIDFEWALQTIFSFEAREPNPHYAIIKRRIAWLSGRWVSEECIPPNNPIIWEILVHLLQEDADTVVRLTAATSLRECTDVLEFDSAAFAPFLASTVPQLIQLMRVAETLESKRKVDGTLNIIIEQSGSLILPFMTVITAPIPQLWEAAENDLLFKASLLVTVTRLLEAVKEHSSSLSGLVVPLIRESLAPANIVQLDLDGLNLWLAALRNTTVVATVDGSPSLRDIFPHALELLAVNLDLLGSLTNIMESYFFLDAVYILQNHAVNLFRAYCTTFNNKILDLNAKQLLQSLGLLCQLAPAEMWGEALHTSGLFPHLLKTLLAGESDALVITHHIYLFSRILLANRDMFVKLIAASAAVLKQTETCLYETMMGVWWERFDNMSEPRHRKLTALGTAVLVSTARPEVLQKLSTDIFNLWLDVFGELREADERREQESSGLESPTSLVRFWDLDIAPTDYYEGTEGTPEYTRRKAVYEADLVKTCALVGFVGSRLQEAEVVCGPEIFQVYMQDADATVLKQIQDSLARG